MPQAGHRGIYGEGGDVYLAQLHIRNFRRLVSNKFDFHPGLNIILGPNNIGKTTVVDALRSLLVGADDPYPRLYTDDIHLPSTGKADGEIVFEFVFRDLSLDDEADFLHALRKNNDDQLEAVLGVSYGDPDSSGRLRARRWCGEHQEVAITGTMLDNLRSVYLQPLRDAEQGLRPNRSSQLSRLLHILSDDDSKAEITKRLAELDVELQKLTPITDTLSAISGRHLAMLGPQLSQTLAVELSGTDFTKLASRLSLLVNASEIERNGLGYNNLIFMAVVLSELAKNANAAYRSLIVEEPEAHLHPQLQAVLLRYLSGIQTGEGEKPVQVFVTSHSPNFASIADLDSISCLVDIGQTVETFHPRSIAFEKGKKEKLKRYLDVTRAEIFFARRVIFVEGAAELLLVDLFARLINCDLRNHGVSLISVEGLNFDSFMPLFGEMALKVPVSVITDADPYLLDGDEKRLPHYPAAGEAIRVSDNTVAMKKLADRLLRVFHGQKTLEYDFALEEKNREAMLSALKDIHPGIGLALERETQGKTTDQEKAAAIFKGMFERTSNNVQKGRFAQALAARVVDDNLSIRVPGYIEDAIKHVCRP